VLPDSNLSTQPRLPFPGPLLDVTDTRRIIFRSCYRTYSVRAHGRWSLFRLDAVRARSKRVSRSEDLEVILVRPAYDQETKAMSKWAEIVKVQLDIEPKEDLEGPSANEEELRKVLRRHDKAASIIVAYYGHGEPKLVLGKWNGDATSPLIHVRAPGVVPEELRGKKLYAVACEAAGDLGPALADVACAFVGYLGRFSFSMPFEKDFGEVVNRSLVTWASETKSKSSREIAEELREAWYELAEKFFSVGGRRKQFLDAALVATLNARFVRSF
jgi:hypothetical protein